MISRLEIRGAVLEAQKLADEAKERHEELLKKGKGVSCRIGNTWYSRPYWEGTKEEFEKHILEKYYEK